MTTWLTADLHFGHKRIIELARRPFDSLDEMHEHLIDAWNAVVSDHDRVFVLGDFGFASGDLHATFTALRGEKHLVIGNHDEENKRVLALPWASQAHIVRIREGGKRIVACHYPLSTWPHAARGYVHAHGHSHGTLTEHRRMRGDVGVDVDFWDRAVWGEPLPFDVVHSTLQQGGYEPVDHHGGVS